MRFYIETFGCQMNEHDSEKMSHLLRINGFTPATGANDADLVIVNTCSVREKAEQKFFSLAGRLKRLRDKKGVILGVTGCIAQQEKEMLKEKLPFIDFALGPSGIHAIVDAVNHSGRGEFFSDFSDNGCAAPLFLKPEPCQGSIRAYVTIMKGCNNFCTYCIVPYVRGREMSRDSSDILAEVENLARKGIKEIVLLGQNVNSYNKGSDDLSFPGLLKKINEIEGIERIRFVTSHPKDLSDELIDCFGGLDKLCEQIHLPFQSGSDRILSLMNRGYNISEYMDKIEKLKGACPDIAITADCIVGFPGEDTDAFMETVGLVKKVEFDGIFSFAYSKRKNTAASEFEGEVPRDEAFKRLAYLQAIQRDITLKKNQATEGMVFDVLVEGGSKNSRDDLTGRTRHNRIVNFRGDLQMIGRLVKVKVLKGYANSLRGERI